MVGMRLPFLLTASFTFLLLSGHLAVAQPVAIGIEGGLQTTGDVSGTLTPESKRYIVGPKLEIRLPLHLSFEFDALYRDVGFTGYAEGADASSITRECDTSWEFPMILKYHFRGVLRLHPFVGIGYAPRIVYGSYATSGSYQNVETGAYTYFSGKTNISYPVTQGLVVSGGVEFGAHHVLISPELRYVHWNQPFLNSYGPNGASYYHSLQDELFALVGIAWH